MPAENQEELYTVARSLLPAAANWIARNTNMPPDLAEDLLMDTVVYFIEKKVDRSLIEHLPNYLFKSFKYRVLNHLRESRNSLELDETILNKNHHSGLSNIENDILLDEILRHLDVRSRFIHDHLVLNYKYKEIVPRYNERFGENVRENFLRSKHHKAIKKLAALFGP